MNPSVLDTSVWPVGRLAWAGNRYAYLERLLADSTTPEARKIGLHGLFALWLDFKAAEEAMGADDPVDAE